MKILFLISIILLLLLLKKNIEPVILSCCGGIRLNHDFKETDPEPPKRVRRCMKDWNSPCTSKGSPDCCEGEDYCKSTREGGKCKKKDGSGYYIYEEDTKNPKDYSPEQERIDISERKKKEKDEGKEEEEDKDDDSEKDGMEILNYFLIGIIIIVILVLVGLFFFSGDDKSTTTKTPTKTPTKTKKTSVLDKHDGNKYTNKYDPAKYSKRW